MENKGEEENMCDTGLVLGLNYDNCSNSSRIDHRHGRGASVKSERSTSNCVQLGRSLSLGIADDGLCESAKEFAGGHRSSTLASKLGDQSQGLGSKTVKKESDEGSEEMERPLSHTSDEEEDGSTRKKLRLTKEQSLFLEEKFKEQSTLNPKQKQTLAEQLNLRPRQVEVWFQNRRARTKLKQTKVDREVLMKCCEKLTDENRRLQKELQELKLLKLSPALLMQHPPVSAPAGAASFTMCPSCERIAGGSDGTKGAGPVVVSPSKPHFLNPFARSATC